MSAIDKLSAASGIPIDEILKIGESVQRNHAKLNGCDRHEFEPIMPLKPIGQHYRCVRCGGEIDHHAYYWHEQGRRKGSAP